jgi:NADPH:quinone reductase-like Zn-dependent oxidoreductase
VGCDYSGTIEAVGHSVRGFTVGEPVFGMGDGSLAEYLAVPAD